MTDSDKAQLFINILPAIQYLMLLAFLFGAIVGAFFFSLFFTSTDRFLAKRSKKGF